MFALLDSPVGQFLNIPAEPMNQAVADSPDLIAVQAGARALTFAELDAHANVLTRRLLAAGVGPSSHVVMAVPASIESVVTVWAAARAGSALAAIDPNDARAVEALGLDWRVRVGVTTAANRAQLPDTITWLIVDAEQHALASAA